MAAAVETRSVFISHSCKDSETAPADDSPLTRARWHRLQYARQVRDAIKRGLTDHGYEVLLDVDDLRPARHWRADLHSWLGTCDGAVVLLDEESVQSDWVRKEATILTWRAQLGSTLTLVPVFLPGFGSERLSEAALDPLRLDDFQAVRADDDLPEEDLAKLVVEQFVDLSPDSVDTPMRRWIVAVAHCFELVDAPYLKWAAEALNVTDHEYAQFTDRHLTLAHHLLHVDLGRALACLRQMRTGLSPHHVRRLVAS